MRRHPLYAISNEEKIARYAHVMGDVPWSIADRAYTEAFARLPERARRELVADLRAHLPTESQIPPTETPDDFARLMRDLHARSALVTCRHAGDVALAFVMSRTVAAFYRSGAGSLSIDRQPPWVHDLAEHETAPIDGGTTHNGRGAVTGLW